MPSCPSCAAPLDAAGVCTVCGSRARGSFRGLDLGPPQVAAAVSRGLDFYRLLDVPPDAEARTIAQRYRKLRALFPDNPERLAPEPARKLELLELAGRVLTDESLRRTYDELRASPGAGLAVGLGVVRCSGCSAPLPAGVARCEYCGTPRPAEPAPPQAPPPGGPPAAEPVDYYALLGLTAEHLSAGAAHDAAAGYGASRPLDPRMFDVRRMGGAGAALGMRRPPAAEEVDDAAYRRQREALLAPGLSKELREARAGELEVARRILRDERRRAQYDALLVSFSRGQLGAGRLDALRALQEAVQAEIREESGGAPAAGHAEELLRQALGYLDARLPREALPLLRKALLANPGLAEAHAAFVRATLSADDPLALGGHPLRQALASIEALAGLGRPLPDGQALAALCRGLIARDEGHAAQAEEALREAVRADAGLGVAWRALAALALARGSHEETLEYSRRALAADRGDERALLLVTAACLRAHKRGQAREAAEQVARLRGQGWSAEAVLHEVGG